MPNMIVSTSRQHEYMPPLSIAQASKWCYTQRQVPHINVRHSTLDPLRHQSPSQIGVLLMQADKVCHMSSVGFVWGKQLGCDVQSSRTRSATMPQPGLTIVSSSHRSDALHMDVGTLRPGFCSAHPLLTWTSSTPGLKDLRPATRKRKHAYHLCVWKYVRDFYTAGYIH